jgi:phosphate-binding protein
VKKLGLLFIALFAGVLAAGTAFAGNLVVNGSTTVLPISQSAAEAFMAENRDVKLSVSGGGSGNGIKALIDGTCDIANSSRFMKDSEVKLAVEKGLYPVPFAVAIDAIVPIVNPSNKVANLTTQQLQDIYTGAGSKTGSRSAARTSPSWSSGATPVRAPSRSGKRRS